MANIKRPEFDDALPPEASLGVDWSALAALARLVRIDPVSGEVTLSNGAASITLQCDGTVRIDARRIVNHADEDIVLSAARIDLN